MLNTHAALRSQAAEYLDEIAVLQDRIQEVQAKLRPVQLQLDAITYPVLTLPSEITSEIFVYCLPDKLSGKDSVNTTEAPLLLLQICSQWRHIALSTPKLWTELELDLPSRDERAHEIAETWLEFSRQHPLSVTLKGPIAELDDFEQIFEAFIRHASEIRSLKLDVSVDDWSFMPDLVDFSHLRDLSLRLIEFDQTEDEAPEDRLEMFRTSHELHRVLLHQIPCRILFLPWQQILSFTGLGCVCHD